MAASLLALLDATLQPEDLSGKKKPMSIHTINSSSTSSTSTSTSTTKYFSIIETSLLALLDATLQPEDLSAKFVPNK